MFLIVTKFIAFILINSPLPSQGTKDFFKINDEVDKPFLTSSLSQLKPSGKSKRSSAAPPSSKRPTRTPSSDSTSKDSEPQVQGLILKFHSWPPNKEEAELILQEAERAGLKKTQELDFEKVWIFKWINDELTDVMHAHIVCTNLPKTPSLEYCRPNFLPKLRGIGIKKKTSDEPLDEHYFHRPRVRQITKDNCGIICEGIDDCPSKAEFSNNLHPYWAQRAIGADLLKEELRKQEPEKAYIVDVVDFGDHGLLVYNLISGSGMEAVLPAQYGGIAHYDRGVLFEHTQAVSKIAEETCRSYPNNAVSTGQLSKYQQCKRNHLPSFLNFSAQMDSTRKQMEEFDELEAMLNTEPGSELREKYIQYYMKMYETFKDEVYQNRVELLKKDFTKLDEKSEKQLENFKKNIQYGRMFIRELGEKIDDYTTFKSLVPDTTIILAAGYAEGYGSQFVPEEIQASKDYDVIIVGSMDPNGLSSVFSQPHREVHIMAPGSDMLSSKGGVKEEFNGTSAAAPLVTGSLAGFTWLSGYSPTPRESKILLEKTAVPTMYLNEEPRMHGVGMVNAYKLGMLGKQLKQMCGTNISCFKEKIRDPSSYKFPEDQGLEEDIHQAFPECSPECGGIMSDDSCSNKAKVFKRLRQAVFLNPSDKKLWASLACIYQHRDFEEASFRAEGIHTALFGPIQEGRFAMDICKQDSDCVLVPPCSDQVGFFFVMTEARAEIEYAMQRCPVLCNGKCRCDQTETTGSTMKGVNHSSQCVNSWCTLKSEPWDKSPLPPTPNTQEFSPPTIPPSESYPGRR